MMLHQHPLLPYAVLCILAPLCHVCASLDFSSEAAILQPWLVNTRRHLHQFPELIYHEYETSKIIRKALDDLGVSYRHPVAKTGVIASIGGGSTGSTVALRADIDALPIEEQTGVAYRSKHPGRMHACGHDSHATMLLGAAKLLKAHESELSGSVRLIFQPAEESGAGGELMVKEGAVEGVGAIFALHVWPYTPSGTIAAAAGPIMSATVCFEATFTGLGGHGGMPHTTVDPIVAVAATISALQALVSRETSPLGSAVLSVTRLAAGEGSFNVVPDKAVFGATLRSLSNDHLMHLKRRVEKVLHAQADSFGCTAELDWLEELEPYYPATVNDPETYEFAMGVADRVLGDPARVLRGQGVSMVAEDFSYYGLAGVPSTLALLGIRNESAGAVHGLHTPRFTLDEEVLQTGAAYLASLATDFLAQHAAAAGSREEL